MDSTDRVAAYLDDVARMLADIDRRDRDEILAGLREHVDGALGALPHRPTPADVERVLAGLGPADQVAAAALADLGHFGARFVPARPPVLDRAWLPALVASLLVVGVVVALLMVVGSAAFVVSAAETISSDGVRTEGPVVVDTAGATGSGLGALLLTAPVWLTAAVLLLVSRLFPTGLRVAGVLLVPLVSVAVPVATAAAVDRFGLGAAGATSLPLVVLALVATGLVVRAVLTIGRARAAEMAAAQPLVLPAAGRS